MKLKTFDRIVKNFIFVVLVAIFAFSLNSLPAAAREKVRLPATELPDYDAAEFQNLDKIVGGARILNFGESAHGLKGMHRGATRMFRYLVEKKGFRVFVFESAWGVDEAMQDFLNSARTEFSPEEQFFLNAFTSKQTLELMLWIREFNRLNPNDQIRLAGFQPEQPVTDFRALFDLASKSDRFAAADLRTKTAVCKASTDQYKTNLDFIIYSGKQRRAGNPTYTSEERAACNQGVDALARFLEENRKELIKKTSPNAFREAQAHLISVRGYLNTLSVVVDTWMANQNPTDAEKFALGRKVYQEGDEARFEIFKILDETRYKNKKTMFWMHNWHAAKSSTEILYDDNIPKGTTSVGTRLANFYGKKLVAVGSVVACPRCKKQALPDSLEAKFAAQLPDVKSAIIDTRNPAAPYKNLPLGSSGSLVNQSDETHFLDVVLSRQFDAVYYLPESKKLNEK